MEEKQSTSFKYSGRGWGTSMLVSMLLIVGLCYLSYKLVVGLGESVSGIEHLKELDQANEHLINQSSFGSGENDLISLEQVESLMYIQIAVKDALESWEKGSLKRVNLLIRKLEGMSDAAKLRYLLKDPDELLEVLVFAKNAQIDALNRESMSLQEYEWIKSWAIAALELEMPNYSLKRILGENIIEPEATIQEKPYGASIVDLENKRMFIAHEDLLRDTIRLSALGF